MTTSAISVTPGPGADFTEANLSAANLSAANLTGADLAGVDLYGANLYRADLSGANLAGADLAWVSLNDVNLDKANLTGANLYGVKYGNERLAEVVVMTGLYGSQCWAAITTDGVPYVRMGCFWHSVDEWDAIGIRMSNVSEFPDDGSDASEERAAAFELTRAKALRMAEAHKKEVS
jgi:hypothetical protein